LSPATRSISAAAAVASLGGTTMLARSRSSWSSHSLRSHSFIARASSAAKSGFLIVSSPEKVLRIA
jgi:hypothetical protein